MTVPTAAPVVDSKPQNFLEINQMTSAASSVGYPSSPVVAPSTPFILPFATGIRRVPGERVQRLELASGTGNVEIPVQFKISHFFFGLIWNFKTVASDMALC